MKDILIQDSEHTPQSSRRAFLTQGLFAVASLAILGCDNTIESGESKNIAPGEKINVSDIVGTMQARRLQVILYDTYANREQYSLRGDYMIYMDDTYPTKAILINSIKPGLVSLEYSEDGYLLNNASTSLSLGDDLGIILASIESNNPPPSR